MKLTSIAVGVVNEINRKLISSFLSKIPKLLLNLQILAMSCDSSAYSVRDWKAIDNIKSRIPIRNNNYIRRKSAIQSPPVINAIIVQLQYQWMINYIFYLYQFDMLLLNSQKKKVLLDDGQRMIFPGFDFYRSNQLKSLCHLHM